MTSPNAEHFRFFDNREKYLLFVTTCSEKREIARRVSMELERVRPTPPALRLFDAGMGDGTVLTTVMRTMHTQFRHMPWLVVGKEISFEDVRQSLEKLADRFAEHPLLVVVIDLPPIVVPVVKLVRSPGRASWDVPGVAAFPGRGGGSRGHGGGGSGCTPAASPR